jgi:hypothetical protein
MSNSADWGARNRYELVRSKLLESYPQPLPRQLRHNDLPVILNSSYVEWALKQRLLVIIDKLDDPIDILGTFELESSLWLHMPARVQLKPVIPSFFFIHN